MEIPVSAFYFIVFSTEGDVFYLSAYSAFIRTRTSVD